MKELDLRKIAATLGFDSLVENWTTDLSKNAYNCEWIKLDHLVNTNGVVIKHWTEGVANILGGL